MLIRPSAQSRRKASHTRLADLSPRTDEPEHTHSTQPEGNSFRSVVLLFFLIVIVMGILGGLLLLNNRQMTIEAATESAEKSEETILIEKVRELIELPANEIPTIATVSDRSKLAGYTFFENAQDGDKILIYTQAGKAIIYRPSTHIVINSAPIDFEIDSTL